MVWSLTVAGLSAVLAVGTRGLSRLRREARPAPPLAQERAQRLSRLLRLRSVPAIRVHPTQSEPCLCGVFRPVVLLPGRWLASASVESLDAVLAHELAHAKRFDHLVNLAQRGLEVLLFFHPGVHWLSRSLRRQGEHCADALAVRLTGDPLALARTLESMARHRASPTTSRPLGAAFGGETTSLLPRIQELIGMTPTRKPVHIFWPLAALPAAAAVALVAASVGFADDKPASPSKAAQAADAAAAVQIPVPATAPAQLKDFREVTYDVRLVEFVELRWRDDLKDRLTPCGPEPEPRAWTLDAKSMNVLMKRLGSDNTTSILQFPRVTAFEKASAVFLVDPDAFSVGGGSVELEKDFSEKFKKNFKLGSIHSGRLRIDVRGSFTPSGTRVSLALNGPSRDVIVRRNRSDGSKPETPTSPPNISTFEYSGSCDVPTGYSLVVSAGQYEHGDGAKAERREQLVLVSPRRVVAEPKPSSPAPLPNPR